MQKIASFLSGFPRLQYAVLPTPIYELKALSNQFNCKVFCKRDDLTGVAFGGNKARKLDYLIADALEKKSDTLIAVGANQSNFCRMATAYGASNGMDVHLVLGGNKPEKPTGNLLVATILGAKCHHIDSKSWDDWEEYASQLESALQKQGRIVYRLPVGGSTAIGTLGYLDCMSEIITDQDKLGLNFDVIMHASSSGGTQAGLVLGKSISDMQAKIIGISVAKQENELKSELALLINQTSELLEYKCSHPDIIVDDNFIGEGYAAITKECTQAIEYFAKQFGIMLDNVYSGKAAAGLLDYLQNNKIKPQSNILFFHTGGNIELFS